MGEGLHLLALLCAVRGHGPAYPKAQRFSLSVKGSKEQKGQEYLCREEGLCKVQVSLVVLGGGIGDIQRMTC